MKANIVCIPTDYNNGRELAEAIENQTYKTTTALRIQLALELIHERDPEVEDGTEPSVGDVLIYELTDFMDECNDQALNVEGYWISYVFFEN